MAEQEQNRSEQATPHKLHEAKRKGQVARSPEVAHAAALAAAVLVLLGSGDAIGRRLLLLCQQLLARAGGQDWSPAAIVALVNGAFSAGLQILAPLLIAIVILVVLAGLAQVGPVLSFHPIKPDFERIHPVAGLKRMLSPRILYEAAKSVAKLLLLALVLWQVLRALLAHLAGLGVVDPHRYGAVLFDDIGSMLNKLLLVSLAIVLVDVVQSRRQFAQRMKMSKREVTDEHKQRDGDPRIRQRIGQLRQEFLKKTRSMRALPDADVLLTNPTHLAVAISYKHGDMQAPKLLAKGAGQLAARMRASARRLHIPVVENPPLARALYRRLDVDQYLPEDLYPQVAKILLWVYALRARGQHQQVA